MAQGKSEGEEVELPAVTFSRELKGERGKKIIKRWELERKSKPFITPRQVILSIIDTELNRK